MKKLIELSEAAALTMSTQTVLAADPSASTSPKAQATTSDLAEFDKQMAQMQQNMKAMQEQMDKIRQTQDPQARGCPKFCVNGQLAGNCHIDRRHHEQQETRCT